MAARRLPILFMSLAVAALLTPRAMAEGDQGCDEGWTQFGSRCFKFFSEIKTWTDAEKSCHSFGANLPSIHSEAQNTFIVDLIVKATGQNTRTWLGGTDAVEEGKWLWSDGTIWDFTRWPSSGSQPDNHEGKEHCLMVNYRATFWNDDPNSRSLFYVCAKDVPKPKDVSLTLGGYVCHCSLQSNSDVQREVLQSSGAATENARSPLVLRLERGTGGAVGLLTSEFYWACK
ncbi:galactose-specific lectin nattectin-like [Eucyclogobius newberryi]|uniref:galactose-specific lectin nattectin-like n=1 Tax=Eucyclogobius newberryi TaxID=166745 RepID=UPI003B598EFF